MTTMSAMLKATFRCMRHLWVHPNAKSGLKMRKKSIRSNPQSCSLCVMIIISVLQGCKIEDLNGPSKNKSMITISAMFKALPERIEYL
jgi:hypothetical protein